MRLVSWRPGFGATAAHPGYAHVTAPRKSWDPETQGAPTVSCVAWDREGRWAPLASTSASFWLLCSLSFAVTNFSPNLTCYWFCESLWWITQQNVLT